MKPDDVNPAPVVEPVTPAVVPLEPKPGDKTDPSLLLKSLQDEREKRRIAEDAAAAAAQELAEIRAAEKGGEVFSDEGKILKAQIDGLTDKLAIAESKTRLEALQVNHPALADKSTEFENYRNDPANKGMSLETAAKAFLAENNLLVTPPARKGLEEGTGGSHTPPKQGMTPQEIDQIRQTDYRRYSKMLRNGEI